mmetsp:Transcript_8436/g.23223  ORF Transcript_8436/g.23223 Transcript_8436/m.23223 type:complete len:230 (+) Transcript_8436:1625-2314(+)
MEHVAAVIRQTTRAVPRLAVKVARNVLYDALHFSLLEDDRGKRARRLVEGSHGPHAVLLLIDGVVLDIACEDLRDAPQAAIQASPALAQNFSGHRLSLGAGAEHVQCEVRAVDRAWSRLVVAGTRLVLARLGGHPDERVPEPQALCEASLDVGHEKRRLKHRRIMDLADKVRQVWDAEACVPELVLAHHCRLHSLHFVCARGAIRGLTNARRSDCEGVIASRALLHEAE